MFPLPFTRSLVSSLIVCLVARLVRFTEFLAGVVPTLNGLVPVWPGLVLHRLALIPLWLGLVAHLSVAELRFGI